MNKGDKLLQGYYTLMKLLNFFPLICTPSQSPQQCGQLRGHHCPQVVIPGKASRTRNSAVGLSLHPDREQGEGL